MNLQTKMKKLARTIQYFIVSPCSDRFHFLTSTNSFFYHFLFEALGEELILWEFSADIIHTYKFKSYQSH